MPPPNSDLEHLLKDGVPDWDAITFDVLCSRCGYNLRTLSRPKCTECGLDFEWPDVLHQSGFRSPFLFEHNWRKRPIGSFFETVWRARNPWRFWRSVSIHDRVFAGPLLVTLLLSSVVFWMVASPLAAACETFSTWGMMRGYIRLPTTSPTSYIPADALQELATTPLDNPVFTAVSILAIVGLHGTALAVVILLRQTLKRFRIRGVHVLRAVAYSAAPLAAWWAILHVIDIAVRLIFAFYESTPNRISISGAIVVSSVYLAVAARLYLGVPHSRLVGIAAYVVAFLFMGCVAVACGFVF